MRASRRGGGSAVASSSRAQVHSRRALPSPDIARFRFGDLVTFTVLDGRQYRTKQPCEVRRGAVDISRRRPARTFSTPSGSSLGVEQEKWLFTGFKETDAAWNILAQGQLVAQLRQKIKAGEAARWTDGWDGYPVARQRILEVHCRDADAEPRVHWRGHSFVLGHRPQG